MSNDFWIVFLTCSCSIICILTILAIAAVIMYQQEITYFLLISKLIKEIISLLFGKKSGDNKDKSVKAQNHKKVEIEDAEFTEIKSNS